MEKIYTQKQMDELFNQLTILLIEYDKLKEYVEKNFTTKPNVKNKPAPNLGASWNKRVQKFESRIRLNGKKLALGYYKTSEEAGKAYTTAIRYQHEYANPKQFRTLIKAKMNSND